MAYQSKRGVLFVVLQSSTRSSPRVERKSYDSVSKIGQGLASLRI